MFGTLRYEFSIDTATGASISEGWAHRHLDSAAGDRKRPFISAVIVNVPTERFDTLDGIVAIANPSLYSVYYGDEFGLPTNLDAGRAEVLSCARKSLGHPKKVRRVNNQNVNT